MIIKMPTTLGAVLAGGKSRRLGRDKARVELEGLTLVERAVATLSRVFPTVIIVSPEREGLRLSGSEVVPDLQSGQGPLGGIATALHWAGGQSIFVLACDMPFVSSGLVEHVIRSVSDEGEETPRTEGSIACVPRWLGRLEPLCALYRRDALPHIEQALAIGAFGVQDLLETVPIEVADIGRQHPFSHPELFMNINRPVDLVRAESMFARGSDQD